MGSSDKHEGDGARSDKDGGEPLGDLEEDRPEEIDKMAPEPTADQPADEANDTEPPGPGVKDAFRSGS